MNTLLKRRIVALFSFLMLCVGAQAEQTRQVINGISYIIDTDGHYAVLFNVTNSAQDNINIPASITWEGNEYPVTDSSIYYNKFGWLLFFWLPESAIYHHSVFCNKFGK